MKQCKRYWVSGRVQGVCYRASTCDFARSLQLTGWVRNLPDGRVELIACGEQNLLQKLESWLWQGPEYARVDEVEISPEIDTNYDNFVIVK